MPPQGHRQPPPPGGRPPGNRPPGGPGQPGQRQSGQDRRSTEQPTGYVAPASFDEPGSAREPELLTHHGHNGTERGGYGGYDGDDGYDGDGFDQDGREASFLENGFDDEDGDGTDGDGKKRKAPLTPAQRKKRRWKRVRRTLYVFVGVFLVLPAVAFAVTYLFVDVPSPEEVAADQGKVVTFYYANGQEMGKDVPADGGNRILLQPEDLTPTVKHAVYAAEDATFETNSGFDISGIMRAVWNQVSGGAGGGSTISQQYVKKATENDEYSYVRKWNELVQSFKMNNEYSKDEIITAYLNTIYFGRGAYGIQTAAQAFYGKDAKDLNASEASMLAGLIQQPGRSEETDVRQQRWSYVMDQMLANKWVTKQERETATLPKTIPADQAKPDAITGPDRFIENRVKQELAAKGYPEEKVAAGGYKVYTTIEPRAQKIAKESATEIMNGEPKNLRKALVAVNPRNGGVLAYYGGPNKAGVDERDWAATQRNPGSSFKPFDLVAFLQRGKGLGEKFDGTSPRDFGPVTVANAEGSQCPDCTVAEAMERSINTVFYDMVVNDIGPQAVVDAATAAGIPKEHGGDKTMGSLDGNISIGGGDTLVTPTDMAGAYSTFANNGTRHETHFVSKLTTSDDKVLFDETTPEATRGEPAFDSDPKKSAQIANNVTHSLEPIPESSEIPCAGSRPCAGKTGTHQYDGDDDQYADENAQAWMVGYTPQISAAAWVGTGTNEPIFDSDGGSVYGSGLPGDIWQEFMNRYLEGLPVKEFPEYDPIGTTAESVEAADDASETQQAPPPTTTTKKPPPTTTTQKPPPPTTPPETSTPTETETETTETDIPDWPIGGGGGNENEPARRTGREGAP